MSTFRVQVQVMPRRALLDPHGNAVQHALGELGFRGVDQVRLGKALTLTVNAADAEAARRDAEAMCEKLLANPVTEDYAVSVEPA